MHVKLDEDLSPMVAEPLRAAGHDVKTVIEQGWGGLKDADLWSRIANERVFFIPADKGFGDIRTRVPGTHDGILLLRPNRESVVEFRALVAPVLAAHPLESLARCLTVATPRGIRVRRPAA